MGNLYIIDTKITELLDSATDWETGEINEEASAALDLLFKDKEYAALELAAEYKNEVSECNKIQSEIDALVKRREAHDARAASRLRIIHRYIDKDAKYSDGRSEIGWQHSKRVIVPDVDKLPAEYQRRKEVVEPNKTELARALRTGAAISGAWLEPHDKLVVK